MTDGASPISGLRWGGAVRRWCCCTAAASMRTAGTRMLLLHPELDALALDLPGHGHSSWFDDPLYLPEVLAATSARRSPPWPRCRSCPSATAVGGHAALALAVQPTRLVAAPRPGRRLAGLDAGPQPGPHRLRRGRASPPSRHASTMRLPSGPAGQGLAAALGAAERPADRRRALDLAPRFGRDPVASTVGRRTFEELPKGWDHAAVVQLRPSCSAASARRSSCRPTSSAPQLVGDLCVHELADAGHNIHGDQPLVLGEAIVVFARDGRSDHEGPGRKGRGGHRRGERHRSGHGRPLRGRGDAGRRLRHRPPASTPPLRPSAGSAVRRRRAHRRLVRPTVRALVAATLDAFGAVHVVCNNAGVVVGGRSTISPTTSGAGSSTSTCGDRCTACACSSRCSSRAARATSCRRRLPRGSARRSSTRPYSVAKAGVIALMETVRRKLEDRGSPVGASVLCPGPVATPLIARSAEHARARCRGPLRDRRGAPLRRGVRAGSGRSASPRPTSPAWSLTPFVKKPLLDPHPPRVGRGHAPPHRADGDVRRAGRGSPD